MNIHPVGAYALVIGLGLSGCAHLQPPNAAQHIDVPESWTEQLPPDSFLAETSRPATPWWTALGSAELDRHISVAMSQNRDIQAAYWKIEQARQGRRMQRAALFPTVDGTVLAAREGRSFVAPIPGLDGALVNVANSYQVGVSTAWEADIWGANRRALQSVMSQIENVRLYREALALSLSAQVGEAWFDVLYEREMQELLSAQQELVHRSITGLNLRRQHGMANALDVTLQEQRSAGLDAALSGSLMREELALLRLAALLEAPAADVESLVSTQELPTVDPLLVANVSTEALVGRPDVIAALAALRSAEYSTVSAFARRLPSLRLSAGLNFSNPELRNLFEPLLGSVAAQLVAPIFDAGRRRAAWNQERARVEELLLTAEDTLINAVFEVRTSLVALSHLDDQIGQNLEQLELAEAAYELGSESYVRGAFDTLALIDLENALLQTRVDALNLRRQQLSRAVSLQLATGGHISELSLPAQGGRVWEDFE